MVRHYNVSKAEDQRPDDGEGKSFSFCTTHMRRKGVEEEEEEPGGRKSKEEDMILTGWHNYKNHAVDPLCSQ